MPVVKFTTTDYGLRGEGLILSPDAPYRSVLEKAFDRIHDRNTKRQESSEEELDRLPLDITIEWHARKMSFDQLKLFWVLLEIAASMQADAAIPSPGEIKRLANSLYEDYLKTQGPRAEVIINAEAEMQMRERFDRILVRSVLEDGRIYLIALLGASQWTTAQATAAIDYWFNELASMGVPVGDEAGIAHYWREWRLHLATEGIDIVDSDSGISADEYRLMTPISECCGSWLGLGGEIAHIKARGVGGNPEDYKDRPGNWLHLCVEHHRQFQHQKGWASLVKIAPWLRPKVEKALGRKV